MTDKKPIRLKRQEMLEIMVAQSEEIDSLRIRVEELEAQLANRQLMMEQCGSIAEAALALNGVFEAAQKAADQYLENIKRMADEKAKTMPPVKTPTKLPEKPAKEPVQEKMTQSLTEEQETLDLMDGLSNPFDNYDPTLLGLEGDLVSDFSTKIMLGSDAIEGEE